MYEIIMFGVSIIVVSPFIYMIIKKCCKEKDLPVISIPPPPIISRRSRRDNINLPKPDPIRLDGSL